MCRSFGVCVRCGVTAVPWNTRLWNSSCTSVKFYCCVWLYSTILKYKNYDMVMHTHTFTCIFDVQLQFSGVLWGFLSNRDAAVHAGRCPVSPGQQYWAYSSDGNGRGRVSQSEIRHTRITIKIPGEPFGPLNILYNENLLLLILTKPESILHLQLANVSDVPITFLLLWTCDIYVIPCLFQC